MTTRDAAAILDGDCPFRARSHPTEGWTFVIGSDFVRLGSGVTGIVDGEQGGIRCVAECVANAFGSVETNLYITSSLLPRHHNARRHAQDHRKDFERTYACSVNKVRRRA
jgi:hypothetical protein